jgi:hypothetical protein
MLKDVMRNAFAICLQRDRHAHSPFSMTRSGQAARRLLNSDKYRSLADMILNSDEGKLRYRDLRGFVIGSNDARYFNAKKAASMYRFFQPANKMDAESCFVKNNMSFYLSRRA